jgi:hypothetical protein
MGGELPHPSGHSESCKEVEMEVLNPPDQHRPPRSGRASRQPR